MNIHVRLAHPHDVSIIAGFNEEMAKETEGIELHHERLRNGVETLLLDSSKGLYYVAEVANKIVGQAMITYEWSDWRNAIFWWIQSVYVHPEYRDQGVFVRCIGTLNHLREHKATCADCGFMWKRKMNALKELTKYSV